MKYTVSVAVDSRIDVEVEADSFEEARVKAKDVARDVDLNIVTYCEFEPVNAESEDGVFRDF